MLNICPIPDSCNITSIFKLNYWLNHCNVTLLISWQIEFRERHLFKVESTYKNPILGITIYQNLLKTMFRKKLNIQRIYRNSLIYIINILLIFSLWIVMNMFHILMFKSWLHQQSNRTFCINLRRSTNFYSFNDNPKS